MKKTYHDIHERVKKQHRKTVKTCWIAHVKELNGLPLRLVWNRPKGARRKHPCPKAMRLPIERVMRQFRMI